MSRVRWFLLALTVFVALAPVLAFPGAAGAAPGANKPIVLAVDDTFPAPNLTNHCGFDVWAHVSGTFTVKVLRNGIELDRIRYEHVFSGPGGSFAVNHVENVTLTSTTSADGTQIDTIGVRGTLLYHAVVPGHGSVGNNSGREVIQFTWQYDEQIGDFVLIGEQVLADSGPNDTLNDADYAVICELLA
jgi:hypothetical protein